MMRALSFVLVFIAGFAAAAAVTRSSWELGACSAMALAASAVTRAVLRGASRSRAGKWRS